MRHPDIDVRTNLDATVLGLGLSLSTDQRKTGHNNNLLVVGSPGSSKSRGLVQPQLMQCNSNYVVVDPKGALAREMAPGLRAAGYEVMTLDFLRPERSASTWNPLAYTRTQQDVSALSWILMTAHGRSIEGFWDKTSTSLTQSLIMATEVDPDVSHDLSGVLELARLAHETERKERGGRIIHSDFGSSKDDEAFLTEGLDLDRECPPTLLDRRIASYEYDPAELRQRRDAIAAARERLETLKAERREAEDELRRAEREGTATAGSDQTPLVHHSFSRDEQEFDLLSRSLWPDDDKTLPGGEDRTPEERDAWERVTALREKIQTAREELESLMESVPERHRCEVADIYRDARVSAGRTWRSVLISMMSALDQWRSPELLSMLSDGPDAVDLASLGEGRKALFVVVPDTRTELYPLVGVLMRQLVEQLVERADSLPGGRLEVPVRVILDDFATMRGDAWGSVEEWVNATRSREIWWEIVVQGLGQLEGLLGAKKAAAVMAGCDTHVYVGAPAELGTARYLAELTGRDVRSIMASGIDHQTVLIRGRGTVDVPRFQPEEHVNWPAFELARFHEGLESGELSWDEPH